MVLKMAQKLIKKMIILELFFGSCFFEVLELFGCLLGAFLGLLRLSWEASGPQKHLKTARFSQAFANAGFWVFRALDDPLGLILAPSWASGPQSVQKIFQKTSPKMTKAESILGSEWAPKWPKTAKAGHGDF